MSKAAGRASHSGPQPRDQLGVLMVGPNFRVGKKIGCGTSGCPASEPRDHALGPRGGGSRGTGHTGKCVGLLPRPGKEQLCQLLAPCTRRGRAEDKGAYPTQPGRLSLGDPESLSGGHCPARGCCCQCQSAAHGTGGEARPESAPWQIARALEASTSPGGSRAPGLLLAGPGC